jgi:hypothetical protein
MRLVEFTRLKKICFEGNQLCYLCYRNQDVMEKFISVQSQHTSLEELGLARELSIPHGVKINSILARNCNLNRAAALLTLQPRTGRPLAAKSGIWYMALAKMGTPKHYQQQVTTGINHYAAGAVVAAVAVGAAGDAGAGAGADDDDDDDGDDDDGSGSSANGSDDAAARPLYPGASAIFKIFQARPALLEYQLPMPASVAAVIQRQYNHDDTSRATSRKQRRLY